MNFAIFTAMLSSSFSGSALEAGCDEAGRGCLAGPVVAAAVILPPDYKNPLLNDSKQLTKAIREQLRGEILRDAIGWAVAEVDAATIDKINILQASFLAMHKALAKLKHKPELILVDGNRFKPYRNVPHECIIKGDGIYASIAAASILAKTTRDRRMERLATRYPGYGWATNMGYPTMEHRQGIRDLGITAYHRKSFTLLPPQLELFDE